MMSLRTACRSQQNGLSLTAVLHCFSRGALLWSGDHGAHALWIERLAAFIEMAGFLELGADLAEAQTPAAPYQRPATSAERAGRGKATPPACDKGRGTNCNKYFLITILLVCLSC